MVNVFDLMVPESSLHRIQKEHDNDLLVWACKSPNPQFKTGDPEWKRNIIAFGKTPDEAIRKWRATYHAALLGGD